MRFLRSSAALFLAAAITACGSSTPTAAPDSQLEPAALSTTQTTTAGTEPQSTVETTTTTEATTTTSTTEVATTTTIQNGLATTDEVDRKVLVSEVILADPNGNLLATVLDSDALGCEGAPPNYYATVGADGSITPDPTSDGPFHYAGFASPSPGGGQMLEVSSCEGFLGAVTVWDIDPGLTLSNPVEIDTRGSLAGDAAWNTDGFITMVLRVLPSEVDPVDDEPAPPKVAEYLVNPRSGESTQSGSAEELRFGSVRIPDGSLVYNAFEADPYVAVLKRGETTEERYSAGGFAVSPDRKTVALWDTVWAASGDGLIELLDLASGDTTTIGNGFPLSVTWADDNDRLAYSAGDESFVYELSTGETVSVGSADPVGCESDDFVTWGRVPMAFAPDGDLYVGDPVCGRSSEDFPTVEYRLHQVTLN